MKWIERGPQCSRLPLNWESTGATNQDTSEAKTIQKDDKIVFGILVAAGWGLTAEGLWQHSCNPRRDRAPAGPMAAPSMQISGTYLSLRSSSNTWTSELGTL
jgi:hypothetical protein